MIAFRLNHALHLQYEKTMSYEEKDFASSGVYVLYNEDLIVLGEPFSMRISFAEKGVSQAQRFADWRIFDREALPKYEEHSIQSELLKYLLMVFRRFRKIEPYADVHMESVLLNKLNQKLRYHNLQAEPEEVNFLFRMLYFLQEISLEAAADILDTNHYAQGQRDRIRSDFEEAQRLRGLGQHESAVPLYLRILSSEKPESIVYTQACFGLGEAYYFADELALSAEFYQRCIVELLPDFSDFYIRLGHTYLDERMKEHAVYVKNYYKGKLSEPYKQRHKAELEEAALQVGDDYVEYEETCEKIGRGKYRK